MAFNPNTIWVSHTSLNDFGKCKQLYYLRGLYRDQKYGNNFRIQVASPYLSLGEAVHDAIDQLIKRYPKGERSKDKLFYEFNRGWKLKPGKVGGFQSESQEKEFKARGEAMLERFWKHEHFKNSEPILVDFPKLPLIGQDEAILVGNFDWLEKNESGLHILDFKTGQNEEEEGSRQLPLYAILGEHVLKKPVTKVSYWYLDKDDEPVEMTLPDLGGTLDEVKTQALEMQKAVNSKDFACTTDVGYCRACHDYHAAINDIAEHVATDFKRKREVFFLPT
ncbi:MAG: PD-(D/E)XK nuclease family protein [bacterium]|nr:PD-(D/E)XK nuclease family protein [bacterium]